MEHREASTLERKHHANLERLEKSYIDPARLSYIDTTITELLEEPALLIAEMYSEGNEQMISAVKEICSASTYEQFINAQCALNDAVRVYAGRCALIAADFEWPSIAS